MTIFCCVFEETFALTSILKWHWYLGEHFIVAGRKGQDFNV